MHLAIAMLVAQGDLAPTLLERAIDLVQPDKKRIAAINKIVVLPLDEQARKHQMQQIRDSVKHFMDVEVTFTCVDSAEGYWNATAPEAAPTAIVREATTLEGALNRLSKMTGIAPGFGLPRSAS
jgi:uncharacterized protein YaeQ